jgi:CRP-like cAMP-binding protein
MLDSVSVREGNGLLALLPAAALEPMLPHFSVVPLAAGIPLGEEIYFLLSGLVSTFVLMSAGQVVYTGVVGREGAVGLTGVGSWSPVQTAMLVAGTAAKIARSHFRAACSESSAIRELQMRYSELMISYAQQGAACNALHDTKSRLCTWLLRAHDRLPGEALPFTQQLLAQMVGVRRSTVTFLACELQEAGLLRYSRGRIHVLSRAGLEKQACECYRITECCANRVFPPSQKLTDPD